MRVIIPSNPFEKQTDILSWTKRGMWACRWISPMRTRPPFTVAFRCRFASENAETVRVHVTADERYVLFLNGAQIGRGSERGCKDVWYFETYDLPFQQGENVLVAQVWALGKEFAPYAQMSVEPGFLLCPDAPEWQDKLATGIAAWDCKSLMGYRFYDPDMAWGTGANVHIVGSAFDWGFETGKQEREFEWKSPYIGEYASTNKRNDRPPTHLLTPATLPPMMEKPCRPGTIRHISQVESEKTGDIPIREADNLEAERIAFQNWWKREEDADYVIPAHTMRRVIIDLENYYCAYPVLLVSGGMESRVRIHWQEALYQNPRTTKKGHRDEIEGKYFVNVWSLKDGTGDAFLPEGGERRHYTPLWWQCGRYIELLIGAAHEPLVLHDIHLVETRYPFENIAKWETKEPTPFDAIFPLAVRTWQMCAHETYMDCPFFEQLQYIGDTRIQALVTYVLSGDPRLPRKALEMFAASLMHTGLTQSRYPSRVDQCIPPFSLWFVGMVYDYAMWVDDLPFVREMMPTVRRVIDTHLANIKEDGLFHSLPGWNTLDWVPEWKDGVPPDGDTVSGTLNWQLIYTLSMAERLERLVNEMEMAKRMRVYQKTLTGSVNKVFWNEQRGLYADDLTQTRYSEHTQCFAILAYGAKVERYAKSARNLLTDTDLSRATIYFSHYLFEAFQAVCEAGQIFNRLALWRDLQNNGLKTTIEMPEPTRSDCHAWGAHPIYHAYASIAGIRPREMGFGGVLITPDVDTMPYLKLAMPHPQGEIIAEYVREGEKLHCNIALPSDVNGLFWLGGRFAPLKSGMNHVIHTEQ